MSQSTSDSGVRIPKDSGNEQYRSPNISEPASGDGSQTKTEPEPACQCRHVGEWEWVEIPYTAGLAASYDACKWGECFADGPPDVDSVETVVRSRRYPSVFHRVKEDHQSAHDHNHEHESVAESAGSHSFEDADPAESESESESLESLTDLRTGDEVTWDCLEVPLVVIERDEASGQEVLLKGPSGGEYQLHTRYDGVLVVYPGYGCIDSLTRIVSDDHPRPQPEAV